LAAITHLSLLRTFINSAPAFVFPNLVTLTLYAVMCLPFSREAFPSLRAVRLIGQWRSELPFRQLDALEVDYEDQEEFPAHLLQHSAPVLVHLKPPILSDSSAAGPAFSDYEHFHVSFDVEDDGATEKLKDLEHLVEGHAALKYLCLPSTLSPSRILTPTLEVARTALLDSCVAQDVTVLWCRRSSDENADLGISKEFWDYAKEIKRKKQLEEVEKSSGGRK
jgi:hypothetical protein